jgi:hypothetical protein
MSAFASVKVPKTAAISTVPQIMARLLHEARECEAKATGPKLARLADMISEEMHLREHA